MRIVLDTLTRFLDLGSRKVLSNSRTTNLPNIFARRDPRAAARSAKVRAAKSAARVRSTQPRAARQQANRPLQRCNTALVPQPATYPHPPGAYILEPSIIIPGFPEIDHRHIPLPVRHKIFLDALFAARQTALRAADEREAEAEAAEAAEFARLVELDLMKAREARRRAEEEAEYARLLEEDRRRAEELHRRAVEEERHRAELEREREESRRRERRERREREREWEESRRRESRERREQERHERHAAESTQPGPFELLNFYEARWATLRGTVVQMMPLPALRFSDIPWPVFEGVRSVEDVTEERILAFVFHPLHALVQGHGEGQAKAVRSELLRWHPDKFDGKVLHKVAEGDREAVRATAGHVVRLLTRF